MTVWNFNSKANAPDLHIIGENQLCDGEPGGGFVLGVTSKGDEVFRIRWQDGPLKRLNGIAQEIPDGAFVEDLLEACHRRMDYMQSYPKVACPENKEVMTYLRDAMRILAKRRLRMKEK